jgi:beta-aspartyl-peptidase (threonine type)
MAPFQYFIRYNAAASVAQRMKFLNETVSAAVRHVVNKDLGEHSGIGGIIALDNHGNGE